MSEPAGTRSTVGRWALNLYARPIRMFLYLPPRKARSSRI